MLIKVLSKMQNRKTILKAMRKGLARGLSWQKPFATMPLFDSQNLHGARCKQFSPLSSDLHTSHNIHTHMQTL